MCGMVWITRFRTATTSSPAINIWRFAMTLGSMSGCVYTLPRQSRRWIGEFFLLLKAHDLIEEIVEQNSALCWREAPGWSSTHRVSQSRLSMLMPNWEVQWHILPMRTFLKCFKVTHVESEFLRWHRRFFPSHWRLCDWGGGFWHLRTWHNRQN